MPGGRVFADGVTLELLIRIAYSEGRTPPGPVLASDIIGGPSWIDSERFHIEANVEGGGPADSGPVALLRLQRLLEDRFGLQMHTEIRDRPVYALVIAGSTGELGPRMRRAAAKCPAPGGAPPPSSQSSSGPACGIRTAAGRMEGRGVEMSHLAMTLSGAGPIDRTVYDRTGLTDQFDFDLEWTPIAARGAEGIDGPAPATSMGPSLFTALQEQLGLRLEAGRLPGEVFVIDRVGRPSPN